MSQSQNPASTDHRPVLVQEAIEALTPCNGGIYVDGTFGGGGYSRRLLDVDGTRVVGIDRDPAAIAAGRHSFSGGADRLTLVEGRFSQMPRLLNHLGIAGVDGVVLDLGVSSMQLDDPARGFSFRYDGPLDMRMSRDGPSAADVVNDSDQGELSNIIRTYGEERMARPIARAIVEARREQAIQSTGRLAAIVRRVISRRGAAPGGIDPATRTFQALRIHINDEMAELDDGLRAAETVLAPGGRLAVVSFHSLEDRRVKTFLRERAGLGGPTSRHRPQPVQPTPSFRLHVRRAIKPGEQELSENRRARSARLRWAERTPAPAWPSGGLKETQKGRRT